MRRWVLAAVLAIGLIGQAIGLASAETGRVRFGAVDAFFDGERADELGARWSRIIFPWERVQRVGPHEWWPAIADEYIDSEVRRGRELVGVLVNTPPWAAASPGDRPYASPPKGLHLLIDHPENYWAAYVARTASAYRGRIDTWIVWNEPDIWDAHHPGYTWSGSVEEFARLQKVAYLAARRGNPEAKVLLPGLTYWWDRRGDRELYFKRLLDAIVADPDARANGWFFDAAVLQLYNDPNLLYEVPTEFRRLMDERGIDRPVWINETNVAPWDDFERPLTRAHFRANQDEQASYLVQAYAMAMAAGVDRISVYKLRDLPLWQYGWESYGIVRGDGSVRPAFRALQMLHRLFQEVDGGTVRTAEGATAVTLRKPGERLVVLWARDPRPVGVRLRAVAARATVYEQDGSSRAIEPIDGEYRLELAQATHNTVEGVPDRYQTGGPPLIVVERGPFVEAAVSLEQRDPARPPDEASLLARAVEALRRGSTALKQ